MIDSLHWNVGHWQSWHDFFAMGGYAFYVWNSFGLTALVVIWETFSLKQRHAQAVRAIMRQQLIQQPDRLPSSHQQTDSKQTGQEQAN